MNCQSHVLILSFDLGKQRGPVFILQSSLTSPKADPSMSLHTGAKVTGKILILPLLKGRRLALSVLMGPMVRGALLEGFHPANLAAPGCCRVNRQQQGWQQYLDKSPWSWCTYEISEGHRGHPQLVTRLLKYCCPPAVSLWLPHLVCKGTEPGPKRLSKGFFGALL